MNETLSPWAQFYQSPLQQPLGFWILNFAFALRFLFQGWPHHWPRLWKFFIPLLFIAINADAWLTADHILGVGGWHWPQPWNQIISTFFVYIGDLRVFLVAAFLAREIRPEWTTARVLGSCLGMAALVPLAAPLLPEAWSAGTPWHHAMRSLFLTYEVLAFLMFSGLVMAGRRVLKQMRPRPALAFGTVAPLAFAAWTYLLWILADLMLLFTQHQEGYVLRVLANLHYYCGFTFFIAQTLRMVVFPKPR